MTSSLLPKYNKLFFVKSQSFFVKLLTFFVFCIKIDKNFNENTYVYFSPVVNSKYLKLKNIEMNGG